MICRDNKIRIFLKEALLLACLLVLLDPGIAQQARFKPVALQAELQQGSLNTLYQDSRGMIWFGTAASLFSYDGMVHQPLAIPGDYEQSGVTAMFEDSKNTYLIGFEDGSVLQYDGFEHFRPVRGGDSTGMSRISAFAEDFQGSVWIGTYGHGVVVWKDTSFAVLDANTGLSDNYIYSMIRDLEGRIWMGTDNGINIVDPSTSPWTIKTLSLQDGLPDFIVQCLRMDAEGDMWIGMYDKGICKFDMEKESFIIPSGLEDWDYGAVRDLLILDDRVWAATSRKGILEYKPGNKNLSFYEHFNNQSLGRVKSMLHDREGNVWLLSGNEVIFSLSNKIEYFLQLGSLSLGNIHALTIDADDRVWFADDRGLFSFEPYEDVTGKDPVKYPIGIDLNSQKIMSLYRDHYGFVWIGTFGQGLIRLDPANGKQLMISEQEGLVNGNILSIAGNQSEIWFGTLGGASRCLVDDRMRSPGFMPEFENYGQDEGLVNNYIYQVYLATDGTPYFATDGNGVQVFRNGRFENLSPTGEYAEKVIYSVTPDIAGSTWINVANEGLLKFDGTGFLPISRDPEHVNTSFSGILSNLNELVIAYDDGIDVINVTTGSIRHFEENAGLSGINPDLNTIAGDSRNNVWVGTSDGIVKYHPPGSAFWEHPRTILTGVDLFLNKIDHRSVNLFTHRENHLSFRYSGLWYQYPGKVEYLIKLEGHDLDWIRTRNDQVIYSDLKPGTYTFRVKAGIYNNYAASNEETYSFEIKPPFYSSAWFYVIASLVLASLLALIFSIRVRQVRRKEEIIQEKIRFQFENLKSQINPHFLFNSFSTLIALIEDDSAAAVDYVEELSTLFRNILEYKDENLVSLEKEYQIAENYISLQKKRFGSSLVVEMDAPESFSGTRIPPLTLQLLIENAIKHNVVSREKPLVIRIYSKPGANRIFVENNIQEKMENAPSMGVGTSNIISRYRLLTGREVEIVNDGKFFTVGLPYIN